MVDTETGDWASPAQSSQVRPLTRTKRIRFLGASDWGGRKPHSRL